MKIEIPDINEIIESTNKALEKRIEKICASLADDIKNSVALGKYYASAYIGDENQEIIDKIMKFYKEAGYGVICEYDYIQVSWPKKKKIQGE